VPRDAERGDARDGLNQKRVEMSWWHPFHLDHETPNGKGAASAAPRESLRFRVTIPSLLDAGGNDSDDRRASSNSVRVRGSSNELQSFADFLAVADSLRLARGEDQRAPRNMTLVDVSRLPSTFVRSAPAPALKKRRLAAARLEGAEGELDPARGVNSLRSDSAFSKTAAMKVVYPSHSDNGAAGGRPIGEIGDHNGRRRS